MDYHGLSGSLDLAVKLLGYPQKPKSNTKEYQDCRTKEKTIKNHLKLGTLDNQSSSESLSSLYLIEYCNYFHCEADFLLGYIDFPTRKTQSVYEVTGLNEKTIHALEMIQLEDKNENTITIIPKNATEKQIEQIIINPSPENLKYVPSGRPLLMDLLNFMFENGNMESLVKHFRNYINVKYKIPVYYDNDKHTFVYPDNDWAKTPGHFGTKDIYWLNFASSEDKPNDCSSIPLTDSFFDTVILKDIEKVFNNMRTDYEKEREELNETT